MAIAITDQQGNRMFGLVTGISELVRDGNRNPEEVLAVLQAIKGEKDGARRLLGNLKKEASIGERLANTPVWRTLTVGGYSREELPKVVEQEKFLVSDLARELMARPEFTTSPAPYTIRLGRVRVGDLGFTARTYTPALFERLAQYFDECPAETGPHLRRIYRDQPMGEWLAVFQKPIAGSDHVPAVFALHAHSHGLALNAHDARPEYGWNPGRELVVRLRE